MDGGLAVVRGPSGDGRNAPLAGLPNGAFADGGATSGAGAGAKGDADAEPTPVPPPPPAPTLVPIPRPDVAPPTANAPVGNPANGAFLPPPDVPKTTARPPST